jgi:hypothetical protein
VNESGDPLVEQTSEAGVHSEGVELESGVNLETTDNPDTAGKPRSINHSLCFIKCYHISLTNVAVKYQELYDKLCCMITLLIITYPWYLRLSNIC